MNPETTPATPAAEPRAAVWEDFLDIYYAPAQVFARRRHGPVWPALLLLALVMGFLFYAGQQALAPMYDAEFQRATEAALSQNPQLGPDQLAQMERMGRTFGFVAFALGFPLGVLVIGLVLWLVGRAFGAAVGFVSALVIATYSQFPSLLQQVVAIAQGLLMSPESLDSQHAVALGPARFLDPDTTAPLLLALAARLDLFTLWVTALIAVGLLVIGRLPAPRAVAAAAVVWLIGGLPDLLGALRGG
jgi:hypothetical protein